MTCSGFSPSILNDFHFLQFGVRFIEPSGDIRTWKFTYIQFSSVMIACSCPKVDGKRLIRFSSLYLVFQEGNQRVMTGVLLSKCQELESAMGFSSSRGG